MRDLEKICEHCGKVFSPLKYWQKYCSMTCRNAQYYIRKAAKDLGVGALDLPDGPSEAQKAEWKRRMDLREEEAKFERERMAEETSHVVEEAEKIIEERSKPSYLEQMYGPKKEGGP